MVVVSKSSGTYHLRQVNDPAVIHRELTKIHFSKWRLRLAYAAHFVHCTLRLWLVWLAVCLAACCIYSVVVFFAFLNHQRYPYAPLPDNIPRDHIPISYNISLVFDQNYARYHTKFKGNTTLTFRTEVTTREFWVNAGENIDIKKVYFARAFSNDGAFRAKSKGVDRNRQIQKYQVEEPFQAGVLYVGFFAFNGNLFPPDHPVGGGYFTPKYIHFRNNKKRSYAIVHAGQPKSAYGLRFISPSLDWYYFPAKFRLAVQHHPDHYAASNMPAQCTIPLTRKLVEDVFAETIVMRPSQLAFVIADLSVSEKRICPENTAVRVHARTDVPRKVSLGALEQLTANSTRANVYGCKFESFLLPNLHDEIIQPGIAFWNEKKAIKRARELRPDQCSDLFESCSNILFIDPGSDFSK